MTSILSNRVVVRSSMTNVIYYDYNIMPKETIFDMVATTVDNNSSFSFSFLWELGHHPVFFSDQDLGRVPSITEVRFVVQ